MQSPTFKSSCKEPHVPILIRFKVLCRGFKVRVAKSTFAQTSSSVTTISMHPTPMPVERTVSGLPRYFPVHETISLLLVCDITLSNRFAISPTLAGSPTKMTLSLSVCGFILMWYGVPSGANTNSESFKCDCISVCFHIQRHTLQFIFLSAYGFALFRYLCKPFFSGEILIL